MDWIQGVLSLFPWQVYAFFSILVTVILFFTANYFFGPKPAITVTAIYVALAYSQVVYDKGGDDRATYIRNRTEQLVKQADANITKRAGEDWEERLARLASEAAKDKEKLDALQHSLPDGCGPVPDSVLRDLR